MSRTNPWKNKPHAVNHTTLIVVEGDTELIFLKHLRTIFGRNCGTRLKIEAVYGGSGDEVVRRALKLCAGFDGNAVLYDGDRAPREPRLIREACRQGIRFLESTPAIEGVLLAILQQDVPRGTRDCKRLMMKAIPASMTDPATFERHFPEVLLRDRAADVPVLAQLLTLFRVG